MPVVEAMEQEVYKYLWSLSAGALRRLLRSYDLEVHPDKAALVESCLCCPDLVFDVGTLLRQRNSDDGIQEGAGLEAKPESSSSRSEKDVTAEALNNLHVYDPDLVERIRWRLRKLCVKDLKTLLFEHNFKLEGPYEKEALISVALMCQSLVQQFKLQFAAEEEDKRKTSLPDSSAKTKVNTLSWMRDEIEVEAVVMPPVDEAPKDAEKTAERKRKKETRVRITHMPKIPKEAAQRLHLLRERGDDTLERQIYEAYAKLLDVNDRVGLSNSDLRGPTSFHGAMEDLRPQVEEKFKVADKRFEVAKRIAAQSPEKCGAVMDVEVKFFEEAQNAAKAYKLMEKLFGKLISRVLDTIDEEELRKALRPEDLARPGTDKEPEMASLTRKPTYGALEALPLGAVKPLEILEGQNHELQHAEIIFLELRELCEKGALCSVQVIIFEKMMQKEKKYLQKATPCRERILRVAAYNRVVRAYNGSFAHDEVQAHKFWRFGTEGVMWHPIERPKVSEDAGIFSYDPARFAHMAGADPPDDWRECEGADVPSALAAPSGAEVQATHEESPDGKAASSDEEQCSNNGDLIGICVSCIGKPASHVVQGCGHLVYCNSCRRKAVAKQLKDSGGVHAKTIKPGQLRNKELLRTRIRCPICREEGVLMLRDKFNGRVYA